MIAWNTIHVNCIQLQGQPYALKIKICLIIVVLKNQFDFAGNLTDLDLDSFFDSNDTNDGIEKILKDFELEFGKDDGTSERVFNTLLCVYGIVIFFGIIGNMIILYAILSKRNMRTPRNYFIVNLAISDLLLCSMTMPLTLWEVLR